MQRRRIMLWVKFSNEAWFGATKPDADRWPGEHFQFTCACPRDIEGYTVYLIPSFRIFDVQ